MSKPRPKTISGAFWRVDSCMVLLPGTFICQSSFWFLTWSSVRFCRLSRIRRELGYEAPPGSCSDSDKRSFDPTYIPVNIVINWAAEGLVLCFIHSLLDLLSNDSDDHSRTNWCGSPAMNEEQIKLLWGRLLVCCRPSNMSRIFQILDNREGRQLLLNWPPDQGHGPSGRDFSRLVDSAHLGTGPDGSDANTSCTRRYKGFQNTPSPIGGEVESIFIHYG